MDTSKEYIKMCEEAKEIQRNCDWKDGDIGVFKDSKYPELVGMFPLKTDTWLPRQDQLQEMVVTIVDQITGTNGYKRIKIGEKRYYHKLIEKIEGDTIATLGGLIEMFNKWFLKEEEKLEELFSSMEQLWLAFVMKEKFGKVWSNDNWIKE